jgi:hypothetical protein
MFHEFDYDHNDEDVGYWANEPVASLFSDPLYALMLAEGSLDEEEAEDLVDERLGAREQFNLKRELAAA